MKPLSSIQSLRLLPVMAVALLLLTSVTVRPAWSTWTCNVICTGDTGAVPYEFTVIIGDSSVQSFIPAPPPPPQYLTWAELYTATWQGPYYKMIYGPLWPALDSLKWILLVDPNGNVMPPVSRTTTVHWNAATLPPEGSFKVINWSTGAVLVANMRIQTSFPVTGTESQYFWLLWTPSQASVWQCPIICTGEPGAAPNEFTVIIGDSTVQSFVPEPPPPPQYLTWAELHTPTWAGPYFKMIYGSAWPPSDSLKWILTVDPNGNYPPPTQSRTTTVHWNAANLPSQGQFKVINYTTGVVAVTDMRTQTSFPVMGTESQYFWILWTPAPLPINITMTPINPPIQVPANGGSFQFNASVQRTQAPQAAFFAWARDRNPDGTYTGNLLGPVNINPPIGVTVTRQRTQVAPASWPAGVHWYIGYAHTFVSYPASDADSFSWTKSTITDGGPMVWEAINYGELFPGEEAVSPQPSAFSLMGASPNPFNPSTTISFSLLEAVKVSLNVYDVQGRMMATLVNGWRETGNHEVTFDGSNLSSGVYLYHLQAGQFAASGKMVLMK